MSEFPVVRGVPAHASEEQLRAVIAEQQVLIEVLSARVAELEERLAQNPRNSSRPPSS